MSESSSYDPMSLHGDIDSMYSNHEAQEVLRAQRAISQESIQTKAIRIISVKTIMNETITQLFGAREAPGKIQDYITQPRSR